MRSIIVALAILAMGCDRSREAKAPAREEASMNAIWVITPYRHNGMWVFDDPDKGLDKEPFVAGADEIIDLAVADIPDAAEGFNLVFSAHAFPGHQYVFERRESEADGYWYESEGLGMKGWLCPALFKYYDEAPERLFAQFQARRPAGP